MDYLLTHGFSWFEDGHSCLENFDLFLNYNETVACNIEPHCHDLKNIKEPNDPTEEFIDNNHEKFDEKGTCRITLNAPSHSRGSKFHSYTTIEDLKKVTSQLFNTTQQPVWKYNTYNSCLESFGSTNIETGKSQETNITKPAWKFHMYNSCSKSFGSNNIEKVKSQLPSITKSAWKFHTYNPCLESSISASNYKFVTDMHIQSSEKPFECEFCDKSFDESGNLIIHVRIHHEKPYSCDTCTKSFAHESTLASHRKIHIGEKPYSCDTCNKSFAYKGNLASHRRIHTGKKPFKCSICGKCFTRDGSLKRHGRIHTREKRYKCTICGIAFTDSTSLKYHQQIHIRE